MAHSTLPSSSFLQLNPRHQRFVTEYLLDQNATQAAIRAGYAKKRAKEQGHQLYTKLHAVIAPLLKAQQEKLLVAGGITKERWLLEIKRLAFYDPGQFYDAHGNPIEVCKLDEDSRRAVVGFEFTEDFLNAKNPDGVEQRVAAGYTKKFKLADKHKALELYGKAVGFYVEKKEVFGHMTMAELLDAAEKSA